MKIKKRLTVAVVSGLLISIILIITIGSIDAKIKNTNGTSSAALRWNNTTPRGSDYDYCESKLNYTNATSTANAVFLKEKYSSLTSLTFVVPSIIALVFFISDYKNGCDKKIQKNKFRLTILARYPSFSLVMFLVGVCYTFFSFLNHACGCKEGLISSNSSLWSLMGIPIIYGCFIYSDTYVKHRSPKFYMTWSIIYVFWCLFFISIAYFNILSLYQSLITVGLTIIILTIYSIGVFISNVIIGYKPVYWMSVISCMITFLMAVLDVNSGDCKSKKNPTGTHFMYHIFMTVTWSIFYIYMWSMYENAEYIIKKVNKCESDSDTHSHQDSDIEIEMLKKCSDKCEHSDKYTEFE